VNAEAGVSQMPYHCDRSLHSVIASGTLSKRERLDLT
jgi:hypothetical protein